MCTIYVTTVSVLHIMFGASLLSSLCAYTAYIYCVYCVFCVYLRCILYILGILHILCIHCVYCVFYATVSQTVWLGLYIILSSGCPCHTLCILRLHILHIQCILCILHIMWIYGVYIVYIYCVFCIYYAYSLQWCLAWIVHYAQLRLSSPFLQKRQSKSAHALSPSLFLRFYQLYFFPFVSVFQYFCILQEYSTKANPPTHRALFFLHWLALNSNVFCQLFICLLAP